MLKNVIKQDYRKLDNIICEQVNIIVQYLNFYSR